MESDISLKSKFDSNSLGLALLDETHRILFWNDWIAEASGISPAAALGTPMPLLLECDRKLRNAIEEAIDLGRAQTVTLDGALLSRSPYPSHLVHLQPIALAGQPGADGAKRHCLLSITPISDAPRAPPANGFSRRNAADTRKLPFGLMEMAEAAQATLHRPPEEILKQQKE